MTAGPLPEPDRRAELLAMAAELRTELHRYCARLLGSVIDGEDVVQDALERALAACEALEPGTSLRPWLFRVAHNRALDLLRGRAVRVAEPMAAALEVADDATPDPLEMLMHQEAVQTAVSRFTELPVHQRSAVILKDVLDAPLGEIAALLDLTVDAVKGHLARGRARLREINAQAAPALAAPAPSEAALRYVALFNRRDWDGLRALLAGDVKLNQATYPRRVGAAEVGMFFSIYARSAAVRLAPAWLESREAIAVFDGAATVPSYFMWLEWREGRISFIHDYRHARYVADGSGLVLAQSSGPWTRSGGTAEQTARNIRPGHEENAYATGGRPEARNGHGHPAGGDATGMADGVGGDAGEGKSLRPQP